MNGKYARALGLGGELRDLRRSVEKAAAGEDLECCPVLHVGPSAPTDGSVFWWDTDGNTTTDTTTETFTGADSYPTGTVTTDGQNWLEGSTITNFGILSNALYFDGHDNDFSSAAASYTLDLGAADGTLTLTGCRRQEGPAYFHSVPAWRMTQTSPTNRSFWTITRAGDIVWIAADAIVTTLTNVGTIPDNATIAVELNGTSHEVFINGSSVAAFTSSNGLTATRHGVSSSMGGGYGEVAGFQFDAVTTSGVLKVWDGSTWQTVGP